MKDMSSICCQFSFLERLRTTSALLRNFESTPFSPQRRETVNCHRPAQNPPSPDKASERVSGNFAVSIFVSDLDSLVRSTSWAPSGRCLSSSSASGGLSFAGSSSSNSSSARCWISVRAVSISLTCPALSNSEMITSSNNMSSTSLSSSIKPPSTPVR